MQLHDSADKAENVCWNCEVLVDSPSSTLFQTRQEVPGMRHAPTPHRHATQCTIDAVELLLQSGQPATEIARNVGIRPERLSRWRREYASLYQDTDGHYAAQGFRELLAQYEMVQSMRGTSNCYANAVTESFWKTLKTE